MLTDFAGWLGGPHPQPVGSQHPSRSFPSYFWSPFPLAGSPGCVCLSHPFINFQCQEATSGDATPMLQRSTGTTLFRPRLLHESSPLEVPKQRCGYPHPPPCKLATPVRYCACARKQLSPAAPPLFLSLLGNQRPFPPKVPSFCEYIHTPCANYTGVKK